MLHIYCYSRYLEVPELLLYTRIASSSLLIAAVLENL